MHDDESPNFGLTDSHLSAFEATLASLVPQSHFDRDRLMFAAGRRAASRRLRVINRILAGTSLAFAGFACLALFPRESENSAAHRRTNVAIQKSDESQARQMPLPPSSTAPGEQFSVALVNGPTNQQLLRLWAHNNHSFDRPSEQPPGGESAPRDEFNPADPSTSRELLLRYLQSTSERL
jgi:hypothetical protein